MLELVRDVLTRDSLLMNRFRCLAFASLTFAVSVVMACGGGRLPAPTYEGQPTSALIQVPYPPPPARTEMIPKAPDGTSVWLDGEWIWSARRWAWKKGRWVVPPANASFSPWTMTRDRTGVIWAASGVWRDDKGNEVDDSVTAAGKSSVTTVVDPEGDAVPRGPDVPADAGNAKLSAAGRIAAESLDGSDRRLLSDGGWLDTTPSSTPQGAVKDSP